MTMPNFLVIGAQKAGTTSLYYYLGQHPQIYMSPVKEPNFFAAEGETSDPHDPNVTSIEAYRRLFKGVSDETAIGEVSPWYLYSQNAPERIKHYLPDAKLIAILRNPIERAYSQFLHFVREGREHHTDFVRALREEEIRVRDNLAAGRDADRGAHGAYVSRGFYYAQLKRYLELFDRDQIKIILSEDLSSDPSGVLQDVFRFLEVDKTILPATSAKHNVSGVPKNRVLHAFLAKPHALKRLYRPLKPHLPSGLRLRLAGVLAGLNDKNTVGTPRLPPEARQRLIEVYRDDILQLQELLQRDLSRWLQ